MINRDLIEIFIELAREKNIERSELGTIIEQLFLFNIEKETGIGIIELVEDPIMVIPTYQEHIDLITLLEETKPSYISKELFIFIRLCQQNHEKTVGLLCRFIVKLLHHILSD